MNATSGQGTRKLGPKRYGPYGIVRIIGKNAVQLHFPTNIREHNVVHVEHTTPYVEQPAVIANRHPQAILAVPRTRQPEVEVAEIIQHRLRGRGYQRLMRERGGEECDAEWVPTSSFVDADGTLTKAFYEYIKKHSLLPELRRIAETAIGGRGGIVQQAQGAQLLEEPPP